MRGSACKLLALRKCLRTELPRQRQLVTTQLRLSIRLPRKRFTGRTDRSQLTAATYEHWVYDFGNVVAGSSGDSDTATLFDSAGDDNYTGDSTRGLLEGVGYRLQVNAFPVVTVHSSSGFDSATLTGSTAVDTYLAQPQATALYGSGYRHNLNRFETTTAMAMEVATLLPFMTARALTLPSYRPSMDA